MTQEQIIEEIKNHPVYKAILKDSFGGVMYNVANYGKYDTKYILGLWDQLHPSMRNVQGGIMKGAFEFMQGN